MGNANGTACLNLCRRASFSIDASSCQVIIGAPDHWHVGAALLLGVTRHLHGSNLVTALSYRRRSARCQSR